MRVQEVGEIKEPCAGVPGLSAEEIPQTETRKVRVIDGEFSLRIVRGEYHCSC